MRCDTCIKRDVCLHYDEMSDLYDFKNCQSYETIDYTKSMPSFKHLIRTIESPYIKIINGDDTIIVTNFKGQKKYIVKLEFGMATNTNIPLDLDRFAEYHVLHVNSEIIDDGYDRLGMAVLTLTRI